jgi:hypothetical protein
MSRLFKTLGAVLSLVFALSFAAPNAQADSFTVTFTCTGTCVSLPTAPDVTVLIPPINEVDVTWQFHIFVLQLATIPNVQPSDVFTWDGEGADGEASFFIFDETRGGGAAIIGQLCASCTMDVKDAGGLTFTPVATATPEPGSLALMLSCVGLMFAMRKRKGLSHAS